MKPNRIFLLPLILLMSVGCQDTMSKMNTSMRQLGDAGQQFIDVVSGNSAKNAAINMESEYFPDERRSGIVRLSSRKYGRLEPYTTRYAQLAQLDSDYLVRAQALRALNLSRDTRHVGLYVGALDDTNELVKLEACKALTNMPDERAIPGLLRIIGDINENRDVRIAAADALKHYANVQVARALINQLSEREFSVAWQARRSLFKLTGQDLSYDEAAWLNYLTTSEKPFV